MLCKVDNSKQS